MFEDFCTTVTQHGHSSMQLLQHEHQAQEKKKNQLPEGEKCELSYSKLNFLESGGLKSNQAEPMHRGIMCKTTRLCRTTGAKQQRPGEGNIRACLFAPHVFILLAAVLMSTVIDSVSVRANREKCAARR